VPQYNGVQLVGLWEGGWNCANARDWRELKETKKHFPFTDTYAQREKAEKKREMAIISTQHGRIRAVDVVEKHYCILRIVPLLYFPLAHYNISGQIQDIFCYKSPTLPI
jgi:hypothetical protein